MQGLQCDRCFREVSIVIIFDSALTFLQSRIYCFSAQNFTDPGVIPEDLRETLHGLTQMEEMLCSLTSPCFLMWVSKGRQYKSHGNVIIFPQDLAPLCTTLPHLPEELDVLLVQKPDAKDPIAYKDFRVQKHKVLSFLHYLHAHNDFYRDIAIRAADNVNLPDDASVLSRLPRAPPPPNMPTTLSAPMLPLTTHSSFLKNFLKSKTPSSLLLVLLHLNRKQYVTTCTHQASHHNRTNLSHGLTYVHLFLNTPLKDCSPWLSPAFSHSASLTRRYAAHERLSFMNGQDTSCIIETLDL